MKIHIAEMNRDGRFFQSTGTTELRALIQLAKSYKIYVRQYPAGQASIVANSTTLGVLDLIRPNVATSTLEIGACYYDVVPRARDHFNDYLTKLADGDTNDTDLKILSVS